MLTMITFEEGGAEPFPKTCAWEVEGIGCRGGCAQWNGHRRRWQSCVNAAGHWRHAGFGYGDQRCAHSKSGAAAGRCWRGGPGHRRWWWRARTLGHLTAETAERRRDRHTQPPQTREGERNQAKNGHKVQQRQNQTADEKCHHRFYQLASSRRRAPAIDRGIQETPLCRATLRRTARRRRKE